MKGLITVEVEVDSQEELENRFEDIVFSNNFVNAGGYTSKKETIDSVYEILGDSLGGKE
jgi:hypothetical protein